MLKKAQIYQSSYNRKQYGKLSSICIFFLFIYIIHKATLRKQLVFSNCLIIFCANLAHCVKKEKKRSIHLKK